MAYKIMVDAGHGGADLGATYEGRQEKDDNLNLALAVGKILSQNGVDVEYTRTTDIYQTPIETGFLNTDEDNERFDTQFQEIAQAIASGILGTLDEEALEQDSENHAIYYRVQTGSFRNRSNADRMLYELLDRGFPAFLLHQDGFYKVQVGAFRVLENAVKMEQSLRKAGYSTFLDAAPPSY